MKKAKSNKDIQLVNARRACLSLTGFAIGESHAIILASAEHREQIADLINQFARLDKKEQKQARAGKKGGQFGKLGGRPKKIIKSDNND